MIEKGNTVSVHYTGKKDDGVVFDTSYEKQPITFKVGSGEIIPGFEKAVIGKKVGDKVKVELNPDEAYGEVREDLIVELNRDQVPENVEEGSNLQAAGENGQSVNVVVKKVTDNHVVVDGNHQLAGEQLHFDVEVVAIE